MFNQLMRYHSDSRKIPSFFRASNHFMDLDNFVWCKPVSSVILRARKFFS